MVLGKKLKRIVGIIGQAKILFDKKTPSVCLIPHYNQDNS